MDKKAVVCGRLICFAFVFQQLITQYRAEYMELRTNVSVKEYAEEVVKLRVEKVSITWIQLAWTSHTILRGHRQLSIHTIENVQ